MPERPHGRGERARAEPASGTETVTLIEATRRAALQEMRRDPRVWVLGEDVARGGLFGQYRGFLEEFGPERVVSTPISEATIMGAGLGAALVGTRPIVEMRIFDFALCAMDELVNQIAKVRYMFGGQAKPALVVRLPHGMWRNSAAQHSQSLEAWFAHLPGVVVVTPATPADAAGLLVTAIRSDDPVLFFDPKDLFGIGGAASPSRSSRSPSASRGASREGDDATLVTLVRRWCRPPSRGCDARRRRDRGRPSRPAHPLALGRGGRRGVRRPHRPPAGRARGGRGRRLRGRGGRPRASTGSDRRASRP